MDRAGLEQRRVIVIPVGTAVLGLSGALAMFFLGMIAARGGSSPGSVTTRKFSFAGTITGITGAQPLTFNFKKPGTSPCVATGTAQPGPFQTELTLDSACDSGFFDGTDVVYDVTVGATVVKTDVPVNPVPYAKYAERVGIPDCPAGYQRDMSVADIVLCKKGVDEIVRVGTAGSAFWVDRYEASLWSDPTGTAMQYGVSAGDYPATFAKNGQWATGTSKNQLYAVSKVGVTPSRLLTWFQAVEACAASGKELPGRQEWLRAAQGTVDPAAASSGTGGTCVTQAGGPRLTGGGSQCLSVWGAQDMIGNLWEWTDEWYAGVGDATISSLPWPDSSYGTDATTNIVSKAIAVTSGVGVPGLPSAAFRGGAFYNGSAAGIFNLYLTAGPSFSDISLGARCIIRQ